MEIWKDIESYEGYQASNLGRIRTYNKKTYTIRHGIRCWKNRLLKVKTSVNKYGRKDERVELWQNGKHKTFLVARLVACTFYNQPLNTKLTVNHIDGNSTNNKISNLELITKKANIEHEFRTGLYKNQIKIKIVDKKTGTIMFPSSLNEGNKLINKNHGYLSSKIKQNIFEDNNYSWKLI